MPNKPTLRTLLNRVEKLVQFPRDMLQIHFAGVPHWEQFVQRIYEHWEKVEHEEKNLFPDYKKIQLEISDMVLLFAALQDAKAIVDQKNKN